MAPPCFGPRSAPMRAGDGRVHVRAGAGDDAAVKVEALNSCSAYRISEVCIAAPTTRDGFSPCSRCRKWPPIESSSVSTSMRLPLWLKWYQYSSIEPKRRHQAVGDVARARRRCGRPFPAARSPAPSTPVRITSIGWAAAGSASSAGLHRLRQAAQRLAAWSCSRAVRPRSAACRAPAGRRFPRIRSCRRRRGCRSRGSAGRCRCGRRCTARCCRRRRRTGRRISSA